MNDLFDQIIKQSMVRIDDKVVDQEEGNQSNQ